MVSNAWTHPNDRTREGWTRQHKNPLQDWLLFCNACTSAVTYRFFPPFQDDFLLRHYDSGKCKGKLGHSRVSVLWHRAQVVGIFAGFGILLLAASPFLLLAAPCIFCCRCKILDKLEAEANSRSNGIGRSQWMDLLACAIAMDEVPYSFVLPDAKSFFWRQF